MRITSRSIQGGRLYQEDRYVNKMLGEGIYMFCIFDGHGGSTVSEFCKNNIDIVITDEIKNGGLYDIPVMLRNVFKKLDALVDNLNVPNEGSTAVICFVYRDKIYFANSGDSLAYIYNGGEIKDMTYEHKAGNKLEKQRILNDNGIVIKDNFSIDRVFGTLNLARSIGDFYLKRWVISDPYISNIKKNNCSYIVLASDGIWDVMNFNDVHNIVSSKTLSDEQKVDIVIQQALKRGSMDNITVTLVFMK